MASPRGSMDAAEYKHVVQGLIDLPTVRRAGQLLDFILVRANDWLAINQFTGVEKNTSS